MQNLGIENAPFIKELKKEIKARKIECDINHENFEILSESLNKLKKGLRKKISIETGVSVIGAILNTISCGVAGSAIQGGVNAILGDLIDFGDLDHLQNIANSLNIGESVNAGCSTIEFLTSNHLLKKELDEVETLRVLSAIAYPISDTNADLPPIQNLADSKGPRTIMRWIINTVAEMIIGYTSIISLHTPMEDCFNLLLWQSC